MENFKFGVELMFDLDVKIVEKQIETLLQNQAVKLLFDSVVESKDVHTLLHVYLNTVKPQDFINYYMKTGCADAYTYTLNDEHTGRSKTQLMNNIQYLQTLDFQGVLEDNGNPKAYYSQSISYVNNTGQYVYEVDGGVVVEPAYAVAFHNINEDNILNNAHLIERVFDFHYNGEEPDELDVF